MKIMDKNPEADCFDILELLSSRYRSLINSDDELIQLLSERNLIPNEIQTNPGEESENIVTEVTEKFENFQITSPIDVLGEVDLVLEV